MRSMWKGSISFGLVMIPVKLYAATEQKDIAFRQVHRTDGGRIRFRRVCSLDGEEIPYEQVAKGFELPSGEMIVLTDEDMADLPLPTTRSIEVLHFMPADQLDPILAARSYFVEPDATGARAYVLLRNSLEQSGKVALAMVSLRQRESLATLRSRDGVLVLETMLWPDEVRAPSFGFLDEDIEVRSQELKMAASLIESMTVDFDPDEYHDNYREALQELVDAKVEGREVIQPQEAESEGEPVSLAEALKASLSAAKDGGNGSGGRAGGSGGGRAAAGGTGSRASKAKAGGSKASGTESAAGSARSSSARSSSARSGGARTTRAASAGSGSKAADADSGTGRAKSGRAKPAAKEASSPAAASGSRSRRRAS